MNVSTKTRSGLDKMKLAYEGMNPSDRDLWIQLMRIATAQPCTTKGVIFQAAHQDCEDMVAFHDAEVVRIDAEVAQLLALFD